MLSVVIILLLVVVIAKIVSFIAYRDFSLRVFIRSFFRFYELKYYYDQPKKAKNYMRLNNFLNIISYLGIMSLLLLGVSKFK
ncbi:MULTISPECIES: hypothetical protein [Chitinophagaceae]